MGLGELRSSDTVAEKLEQISAKTIDRLLAREKQLRQLKRERNPSVHHQKVLDSLRIVRRQIESGSKILTGIQNMPWLAASESAITRFLDA